MEADKNKLCISVPEMEKQMGISRPKAYELANSKGFPAIRVGKRIVIPYAAFADWLQKAADGALQDIAV